MPSDDVSDGGTQQRSERARKWLVGSQMGLSALLILTGYALMLYAVLHEAYLLSVLFLWAAGFGMYSFKVSLDNRDLLSAEYRGPAS